MARLSGDVGRQRLGRRRLRRQGRRSVPRGLRALRGRVRGFDGGFGNFGKSAARPIRSTGAHRRPGARPGRWGAVLRPRGGVERTRRAVGQGAGGAVGGAALAAALRIVSSAAGAGLGFVYILYYHLFLVG